MIVTLASLVEAVTQELGRTPAKQTAESLVNEAGEAWVNAHEWHYLRDVPLEIQAVEGQQFYRLPLGVRRIEDALERPDTFWPEICVLESEAFIRHRNQYLAEVELNLTPIATTRFLQREGDIKPFLYVELFPFNFAERLVATATMGWDPLDKPADQAFIPPPLAQPFLEWVRRYAMAREKPDLGSVDQMRVQFFQGPTGYDAKTRDGDAAGQITPLPGGVGAEYHRKRNQYEDRRNQLEHLRFQFPPR